MLPVGARLEITAPDVSAAQIRITVLGGTPPAPLLTRYVELEAGVPTLWSRRVEVPTGRVTIRFELIQVVGRESSDHNTVTGRMTLE